MSTGRARFSPITPVRRVEDVPGPSETSTNESGRLVSIVVPCCGQLEYTRLCIPSLLQHSRIPYELVMVDMGSLDGTPEYVAGVAAAAPVPVELIRVAGDSDFRQGCAEAFARARGEFVVWLNNDTIVTDGWLQQLAALASGHKLIGMVGPMSNCAPTSQRVEVPYRIGARKQVQPGVDSQRERELMDIETVDRFAREWREKHKTEWFETERLGGFCLLIKREVLETIELFDERTQPGVFDADSLSSKVRQAGFHLACCRDLFIHHFGSRLAAK